MRVKNLEELIEVLQTVKKGSNPLTLVEKTHDKKQSLGIGLVVNSVLSRLILENIAECLDSGGDLSSAFSICDCELKITIGDASVEEWKNSMFIEFVDK